ncbi:hypothetical protein EYF80_052324 [Liparis tanakae]|uniref:Uncharacterized protein n=1 Tax=Liparis tanakae TaxID=230148 RepID=A0A4Z2F8F8_9TELE|nr:hypothetical protein EYF80_052324 [Liparis tanakae]
MLMNNNKGRFTVVQLGSATAMWPVVVVGVFGEPRLDEAANRLDDHNLRAQPPLMGPKSLSAKL